MKIVSLAIAAAVLAGASGLMAAEKTIVDQWKEVTPPAPVELKTPVIKPESTALLILDIEERTVSTRPRAAASVPRIQKLMKWARTHKVLVAYSTTGAGTPQSILPDVMPKQKEHVVKSSVDKFYNTDLESFLKDNNITTLIITGTAAEGAVLGTSIGAAVRGFTIIVPVDGMSSSDLYAEQYVSWHLLNAPAVKGKVTLTTVDMIAK